MREWKATLTSEKSFSGWIFNSAQPPKGTLGMSARRILASVPHNASPLSPRRQISIACGSSVLPRRRDFVPWRFSAAGRHGG
jgi:hypothetical protein